MISKIQKGFFDYLSSLLQDYGISVEFKYNPDLDALNEFRKSLALRVNNSTIYDQTVKGYMDDLSSSSHNLGVFSRTAIRKSPTIGNNIDLEVFTENYNGSGDIELREAFYGEVDYSVKIIFDDHELCDYTELIYVNSLANKNKTFKVDYDFGDDVEGIEGVDYTIVFQDIGDTGSLNGSNIKYLDFGVTLTGLFYLPYVRKSGLLETIELSIHAFNRSEEISPKKATDDNCVHKQTLNVRDKG